MSEAYQACHVSRWFETLPDPHRSWLILGKGPSFAQRERFDLSGFNTVALNHTIREQPALVSHIIDFDVFEACAEQIEQNARYLLMPWVPHVNMRPTAKTLADFMAEQPVLQRLHAQNRLVWYNLGTAKQPPYLGLPVVRSGYFSAEVVVNLLCDQEVRQIRTLGVDGGRQYAEHFSDLQETTRLANQHESFDLQFQGIARRMMQDGLDFAPLGEQTPIRVFVGSQPEQHLAVKTLEYSIKKHASMSVEVFPLYKAPRPIPRPQDSTDVARTHFSFQRFLIPELCGYQGRAIYIDSDMLVLDDIKALWDYPMGENDLLCVKSRPDTERRPQFSVLLLNCETLRWDIEDIVRGLDEDRYTYQQLMYEMAVAKRIERSIDDRWNALEHYEPGRTALIHYTDIPTQPWIDTRNPYGTLWTRYLIETVQAGFISKAELQEALTRGFIRPSLYFQVKHGIPDVTDIPTPVRWLDRDFVAPYQLLHGKHRKKQQKFHRVLYRSMARCLAPLA